MLAPLGLGAGGAAPFTRVVAYDRAGLGWSDPGPWAASADALAVWERMTRPQVNAALSLGALPLAVLSVTEQARYGEVLTALQAALPGLSSNSTHTTVRGATHEGLVSRREHALVVADAIRRVLEAASTGRPRTRSDVDHPGARRDARPTTSRVRELREGGSA